MMRLKVVPSSGATLQPNRLGEREVYDVEMHLII